MPSLQDVTFERNWVKDTWDLSALFFVTACKSTIISEVKRLIF